MRCTLALLMALMASSGAAQNACGPYTRLAMQLDMKYGESIRLRGTTTTTVMEIWANPETRSWTILERFADGTSCIRANGENLVTFEPEIPGVDS